MKDWMSLDNQTQKEALLNEVKGNLFEFVLASELAKKFQFEANFLESFSRQNSGQTLKQFEFYQSWLRQQDPMLYEKLPRLAIKSCEYLLNDTKFFCQFNPVQIAVLGKETQSLAHEELRESDLLFFDENDNRKYLSLKLTKTGAFVNTKSAGIRSFLSKYFASMPGIETLQEQLNETLDRSFYTLSQQMYERCDLDSSQLDSSLRSFDYQWCEKGLSELPGQLSDDLSLLLKDHYKRVVSNLHEKIQIIFKNDQDLFFKALASIVGLGHIQMCQLKCFHKSTKQERYELAHFEYYDWTNFQDDLNECKISSYKDGLASFDVVLKSKVIQIRLKPMNKFTQGALKVNCSIKKRAK